VSGLTQVIAGDEALATFRQGLTGPHALSLLAAAAAGLLVCLPVGAGKTTWLVRIIEHALASGAHDLVVVLVPRRDILREVLKRLPAGLPRVVLNPRPRKKCGALDGPWQQHERQGLGFLGRKALCGTCPRLNDCAWPGQYGRRLRGKKLILGTQRHLTLNPAFFLQLQHQTGAESPLLLLDESSLLIRPAERTIRGLDLQRFIAAQEAAVVAAAEAPPAAANWLELSRLVAQASTADLREGHWRFPRVHAGWATRVQEDGSALFGLDFQFLAYELHYLAGSDSAGRERLPCGDIRFASTPYLGDRFIIFTGSMARDLARYRLDPNHARPTIRSEYADYRFEHPGTRWFNLNSLAGAARFFPRNADRILDFFARLIARNVLAGRRTLLVSRKRFVPLCREVLRDRLAALGVPGVKIVTGDWARHALEDPRVLPLINYGMAGVNRFEHIEAAFCLNSYFVSAAVVSQAVQDIEATTERYPVRIVLSGVPRRRRAELDLPDGRLTLLSRVASQALEQLEADVVVQAVGRVRPFTRPREVITFQAGALPGARYALEFGDLRQAREYFGLQSPSQAGLQTAIERAGRLKAQGYSKAAIAKEMNVSLSTVKRYLRRQGGSPGLLSF
jgi:hypothetical protein